VIAPTGLEELRRRREEILGLAHRFGAEEVRVFGSVARGEEGTGSDVDFLVRFRPGTSLLDQVGLRQELGDLLGREVDVVSDRALHWFIRDRVLAEAVPL
jgi:hypothetical protein